MVRKGERFCNGLNNVVNKLGNGVGGAWVQLLGGGGQGARALFILGLCECIWDAPAVLLVLPAFDDIGALGSPPRQVVYPPG